MSMEKVSSKLSKSAAEVTDHLVVGAGIAGLSLALKLAKTGEKVLVLAKGALEESNTWYAQGGIATVLDPEDSMDNHVRDTMSAGAGLCHADIVKMVVNEGPRLVQELVELGANFDFTDQGGSDQNLHLTKEGGHSHRRVIHAKDVTGKEVARALIAKARRTPNIEIREHQSVIDLVTTDKVAVNFSRNDCVGAYVIDTRSHHIYSLRCHWTYLCTGGHGKLYLYTSNPDSASGDGLAIGWRAGCKVANLEMMQFHPTCLYHHKAKNFLISEAVRGEGGILKTFDGQSFMERYHAMGSLAPRDIVARAIDTELKRSGAPHVWLDVRHLGEAKIQNHFPTIYATCMHYGVDPAKEMIPVVPAAHYSCGGIVTDAVGRTSVGRLFAIGEVACTGLHGANRLASNSLLEAMVFADQAATWVQRSGSKAENHHIEIPAWQEGIAPPSDEPVVMSHAWDEIRRLMWNYVGIVRSERRLKRALDRIVVIRQEVDDYWWHYRVNPSVLEVRNLSLVAWLTVRCAMARKESRGIHYMLDYPEASPQARDVVLH
jgi:L-aspartate oxidase